MAIGIKFQRWQEKSSQISTKSSPVQPSSPPQEQAAASPYLESTDQEEILYNLSQPPQFQPNEKLQGIVTEMLNLVEQRGLSKKGLSITLIDVQTQGKGSYQEDIPRYPASVAKLFWLVAAYGQIFEEKQSEAELQPLFQKMMVESDNEAASKLIDILTGTQSGPKLDPQAYNEWQYQRTWLNRFFTTAGYDDLNISQKTFPIPYLDYDGPEGLDQQIRGQDSENPIRNQITTAQAGRLMYEIATGEAISPAASGKIRELLRRDLRREAWENIDPSQEFNPVRAFFGEYLPPQQVELLSKAGWTSNSRQEVAFINSSQEDVAYILVVFAENPAYAQNWQIFPELSQLVYRQMMSIK